MEMPLREFRPIFKERVLNILWRQWIAIGVRGHGQEWTGMPIDPEALLLVSCTLARHDARLFDASLEWLQTHGKYINIQRIKRMLSTEQYEGKHVYEAMAAKVKTSLSAAKWKHIKKPTNPNQRKEKLFFLPNGRAMPFVGNPDPEFEEYGFLRDVFHNRNIVGEFNPENPANLILRLRSLLGVNARCEILAYLLFNRMGAPRSVADKTYHSPATIIKALNDMRDSGFVLMRTEGRKSNHWLTPDIWNGLFNIQKTDKWIVWPRLYRAIEQLWQLLNDDSLYNKNSLAQASAIRRILLDSAMERFDSSGVDIIFGDISSQHGESLIPVFIEDTSELLDRLDAIS